MGKQQETLRPNSIQNLRSEFYVKGVNAKITFDKNERALTVYQNGQAMKGKKID